MSDMSKVSKKEIIIWESLNLFIKNGYENTSLDEIMNKTGISKGGLYHYFKSKEQLLDGVIDYYVERDFEENKKILENNDLTYLEKLTFILLIPFKKNDFIKQKIESNMPQNSIFHYKTALVSRNKTASLILDIIVEGTEINEFDVPYPEVVCFAIYDIIMDLTHKLFIVEKKAYPHEIDAVSYVIARLLGLEESEFKKFKNEMYLLLVEK